MSTKKKLQSLEEANKAAHERYRNPPPLYNGIACPECGEEMVDSGGSMLLSAPPQTYIHCPSCKFRTTRVVA